MIRAVPTTALGLARISRGAILLLLLGTLWSGESPFTDQITSLRALADAKVHWVKHDTKSNVPEHELMSVKGRYFLARKARINQIDELGNRGQMCAYNTKGYHLLYVGRGQMIVERDPIDPATKPKFDRGNFEVTLAGPLSFLGMVDGDRATDLFWALLFDEDYVSRKTTEVITKQEADGKGGNLVTIKFKTPGGFKNGAVTMEYLGAFLTVSIGTNATCGIHKLVNSITYHDEDGSVTGREDFTYDLVTIPAKGKVPARSTPMLKSGQLTDMSNHEVVERFERKEIDLAANLTEEDLVIDPVLAKDIYDAGTGLTFTPDQ